MKLSPEINVRFAKVTLEGSQAIGSRALGNMQNSFHLIEKVRPSVTTRRRNCLKFLPGKADKESLARPAGKSAFFGI
jgi:hypothetical protein